MHPSACGALGLHAGKRRRPLLPNTSVLVRRARACGGRAAPGLHQHYAWNWRVDGVWGTACHATRPSVLGRCFTPGDLAPPRNATASGRMLFLLGDSHAFQLVAGLSAALNGVMGVAYAFGVDIRFPRHPAASESALVQPEVSDPRSYTWDVVYTEDGCPDPWCNVCVERLAQHLKPGDVVAVSVSEWRLPSTAHVDKLVQFFRGLARLTAAKGANFLLIGDTPYLQKEPQLCQTPQTSAQCATPRNLAFSGTSGVCRTRGCHPSVFTYRDTSYANLSASLNAELALQAAAGRAFHLSSSDLFDQLCVSGTCGPNLPNTSTLGWYDYHHLSEQASLYLAPFLACYFHRAGLA